MPDDAPHTPTNPPTQPIAPKLSGPPTLPAPILAINPVAPESEYIGQAASVLTGGDALILPTDTVYGIAVLVSDAIDPGLLFACKQRPREKSIPLLVSSQRDLSAFGSAVPDYAEELATLHWPGALTLVVRASEAVPEQFVAPDGSIALRMPANEIALDLLRAVGAPLATSSANLSGKPPALSAGELDPELARSVALIIDGGSLTGGVPSTVVSCLEGVPKVLRVGAVPL